MNSRNDTQDHKLAVWIFAIAALACTISVSLLVNLASHHKFQQAQKAFKKAVDAISQCNSETARTQLRTLHKTENFESKAELIECGLIMIHGEPNESLRRLGKMTHKGDIESEHALFTAIALTNLDRLDEAEAMFQSISRAEGNRSRVARGLDNIKDIRTERANSHQFLVDFKPIVDKFCGDCHALPMPNSFPKSHWAEEVNQGFEFYRIFNRHDLDPPDQAQVTRYFELQAPTEHEFAKVFAGRNSAPSNQFGLLKSSSEALANPGVAHVAWVSLKEGEQRELLVSDMRSGTVSAYAPSRLGRRARILAQMKSPCNSAICDLDADGDADILVSELGSFFPEDHQKGQVVCLKFDGEDSYEKVVLLDNVGRVCDVQPGDFDSDGDLDLIVAEFGWRTTGSVLYLENTSDSVGGLQFQRREIDPRHGTIHVPVVDLNLDGHLDFIALISQAHEEVVAFLNDGRGNFSPHTIFTANDPSFGSSGIQLIDLDQDQDVDVLYTNGDTFDSALMKPYHGIQWLENKGDLVFNAHRLLNCFGVYRAIAADFDDDRDMDILAVSALPTKVLDPNLVKRTDSIVCLINDGQQNFTKEVIEQGACFHLTCDVGDFDHDGDVDFATGRVNFYDTPIGMPPIDIWLNQGKSDIAAK
ncbi:FG-GAP repeat domain-containing protein [Rhodopirellula sp. SWK7]|uniref:FG-GAP repeat domain-containing protein n=1 Tax=Rhodopirellula sp. SWK7 TaxID=595460 RepID=UPI0002BDB8BB|nr:VCBS repeat-containing protein [Rhodopirellula sp. SWK7]EMI46962.1 FG-GAP repeat domain protein [Rhodopirellula sp. SWK7]